ncbi:MAG: orotidine-5'-phosphate decarboxylase [Planctomycetaceae bacterium]|nr:orotidine-5'-phosphate decarboxylase [Planctomycetaceae bacterium]
MHTTTPKATAGERLAARLEDAAPVCVGLDPVATRLPGAIDGSDPLEAIERFSNGVLDAVVGVVPCVKIQAACFERYGHLGVAAMERVITRARDAGFVVILDAKRGDIGISATHYAAGAAATGADWITLNGYLGEDGITPFLDAGLGVFVLVRTSNPSGDEIQAPAVGDGTVAGLVAGMVDRLGRGNGGTGPVSVGAVVGATKPEAAAALRASMPEAPFLLPGYGAQGGGADGVRAALDARGGGVLVTASRSIIHAFVDRQGDWKTSVNAAAVEFAGAIRGIVNDSTGGSD